MRMRDKKIIKRGLFEKKWKLCKILELKLFFYPYLFIYNIIIHYAALYVLWPKQLVKTRCQPIWHATRIIWMKLIRSVDSSIIGVTKYSF